jgi:hypothetical protein
MKEKISRMMFNQYSNKEAMPPPYNPMANFEWIRKQSKLPWLQVDIPVPHNTIFDEISMLHDKLVSHRDDYNEHRGWKSGCIYGRSWESTREDSYYPDKQPYVWTSEAQKYLPNTVNYFQNTWPPCNFGRIRIMALEPGGYVGIHRDTQVSQLDAINIAITQPNDCKFVMENHGTVPFRPGTAFWLDISNCHVVFNDSNEIRWHIIVHQDFSDEISQNILAKSYHRLYNESI